MFPRIREITDAFGGKLRVSVEEHPSGALVVLERPDMKDRPRILLDGYGTDILAGYIMSARLAVPHGLPDEHVDGTFGTRFELGLEKPNPKRALVSAATIAGSYIAGGFIPLSPYMLIRSASSALTVSVVVTLIALTI